MARKPKRRRILKGSGYYPNDYLWHGNQKEDKFLRGGYQPKTVAVVRKPKRRRILKGMVTAPNDYLSHGNQKGGINKIAKKSGKIVYWVGSLKFLSDLTQILKCVFPANFEIAPFRACYWLIYSVG